MIKCKHCSVEIEVVPGKVQKQFCSDTHRKAYKRANSGKTEATGCPSVDELRTDGTKQPRTSTTDKPTSDNLGQGVTITKAESHVDASDVGVVKALHQAIKSDRTAQGNIRVSKPGDSDYFPKCETTRAFIEGRDKRPEVGKRGLDIKCFGDLPADVQLSIDLMDIGPEEKKRRLTAAVNYQHLFPDRFHSTGVA